MKSFCFCCCFSSDEQSPPSNFIRVVHINGHVEFFSPPTTSGQVLRKQPKGYAVWTAAQLLATGPVHLHSTDRLEPDNLYFVLPDAVVFHSETSPACLLMLVRRLKAMADRSRSPDSEPNPVDDEPGQWTASVGRPVMWRPELETIEELRSNGRSSVSSSYSREPIGNQTWDNRA